MLKDIFVCGSSHASGCGKGKIGDAGLPGSVKSWVYFLADIAEAKNVWNFSLPGKPVGLTNKDCISFIRQYWEKYRTYENLFVILEYTLPQYRTWDPVAMSRDDTKHIEVVPITYYKQLRNNEHLVNPIKLSSLKDETTYVEQKFYIRNEVNLDSYSDKNHNHMYTEIQPTDLEKTFLDRHTEKVKQWFQFDIIDTETGQKRMSEEKIRKYFSYASDEIMFMKRHLEHFNIPYMMFWVGGQSEQFCVAIDRYLRPMMADNRLLPMRKFSSVRAAQEWSIKHWRSHPDEVGHERIAEFLYDWIDIHKLYQKPNQNIFTGY